MLKTKNGLVLLNSCEEFLLTKDMTQTEENSLESLVRLGKRGEGVYGVVYSACEKNGPLVGNTFAVKRNLIDAAGDFVGSLRELDILIRVNGHPHIVTVNSISIGDPFGGGRSGNLSPIMDSGFKDDKVHFIFEEAIEDGASFFRRASWADLKKCIVHLLLSVEYFHGKGVIHRDLKPANLLVFQDESEGTILKVCDFGLSKPVTFQGRQTPSTVTSWYRAPEILFEDNYDIKVDLWSVGCILYEMVTKLPLLHGSPDEKTTILNHLVRLFPESELLPNNPRSCPPETRGLCTRQPTTKSRLSWAAQISRKAKPQQMQAQGWDHNLFMDLIRHLLVIEPLERYSATEALQHPFLKDYQGYIARIRENFPVDPDPEIAIHLQVCHNCHLNDNSRPKCDRERGIVIAKKIFNDRHKYSWYSHRILFQTISLYDRYLCYLDGKPIENGRSRLAFTLCLYMAIKYFTTLSTLIPFSSLYGEISEEEKKWAEALEMKIIEEITGYRIYNPTIYEAADSFDELLEENHIIDLFDIYTSSQVKGIPINSLTPLEVYELYRRKDIPRI